MSGQTNRLENLKSLHAANADMAFATAFITLTTGAFLVGFAKSLNATPFVVNMLTAIPSLCGLLQIPGAIWGRSFNTYKGFVLWGGLSWRLFYVPLIFLPLIAVSTDFRLFLLILCVSLASVATTIVNPIYNDWLAEMIPINSRGVFFGRRNAIGPIVGAVAGILGAVVLDAFRARNMESQGFSIVYGLGALCATVSMIFFMRMQDLPRLNPVKQNLRDGIFAIRAPFADKEFRKVLAYLSAMFFAQLLPGGLFSLYALETLKLDYKLVQGAIVMQALGMLAFSRIWGFISDTYGNKPVLAITGTLVALNPIPWILCVPGQTTFNAALLLSTHVIMGISWSGVNLCQFNLMLAASPDHDRANYIGAGMTVAAITSGVAPLVGAAMMPSVPTAAAFKTVFFVTIFLRLCATGVLLRVREPGATDIKTAIRNLSHVTPKGVRAIRSLARSSDAIERESAIQELGSQRVTLASDAVIKALHDPQPRVRRQAAATLARLNEPKAVRELVHQLEDHPDLVEEEMLDALGELGDPLAIQAVTKTMRSPRSLVRRAAAKALGRIGAHNRDSEAMGSAVEALVTAAEDPSDPDLRRAALQALRLIGAPAAIGPAIDALMDPHPSVRIAAAEAVVELEAKTAAARLRESLASYDDEASAELAYALGVLGVIGDIPLILAEAKKSVSMITRRRALLGVARLMGVERETYRLMTLEDMVRDNALLESQKLLGRGSPEINRAMHLYSTGDERGALGALAEARKEPAFQYLAEGYVPELFLVAFSAATSRP